MEKEYQEMKHSAIASGDKTAKLGNDKPKRTYTAPEKGCAYEEELCRLLYHDAKKLGINLRPFIEWTDADGEYHAGDTDDDSDDDSDCFTGSVKLVEIPRKFLIEIGKYPPPTADQTAEAHKP